MGEPIHENIREPGCKEPPGLDVNHSPPLPPPHYPQLSLTPSSFAAVRPYSHSGPACGSNYRCCLSLGSDTVATYMEENHVYTCTCQKLQMCQCTTENQCTTVRKKHTRQLCTQCTCTCIMCCGCSLPHLGSLWGGEK